MKAVKTLLFIFLIPHLLASCDSKMLGGGKPSNHGFTSPAPESGTEGSLLPVTLTDLTYLLARPVIGGIPQTAVDTEEYNAIVSWTQNNAPHSSPFEGGKDYAAELTVVPKTGYTFAGFSGVFSHSHALQMGQSTAYGIAVASASFYVDSNLIVVGITDLTAYLPRPVNGGSPRTAVDTMEYSGPVVWTQNGAPHSGAFTGGLYYTAEMTVLPKTGYTFAGFSGFFNHSYAEDAGQSVADDNAVITFTFYVDVAGITITDLTSFLSRPYIGKSPQLSVYTTQYSASVEWSRDGLPYSASFEGGKTYTAVLAVTPNTGYGFAGFSGIFSHSGSISISQFIGAGSAAVTITFYLSSNIISITDLTPLLERPAIGGIPQPEVDTIEYSASVQWSQNGLPFTGTFLGGKEYIAFLTFYPKDTYGFAGFSDIFTYSNSKSIYQNIANDKATATISFYIPISAAGAAPVSFTGQRLEKYYLEADPAVMGKEYAASSPQVLGCTSNFSGTLTTYGYNQITLYNIPLQNLINGGSFYTRTAGTLAVNGWLAYYSAEDDNYGGTKVAAASAPYDSGGTKLSASITSVNPKETFTVQDVFYSGSLALPVTGSYSSSYFEIKTRTYTADVPAGFVKSAAYDSGSLFKFMSGGNYNFYLNDGLILGTIGTSHETALTVSASVTERYVPVSRGFYQYRSFTVTYEEGIKFSSVIPSSAVQSYILNPAANSLTVTMRDYDAPYTGTVITFSIKGDGDLTGILKTITIE